MTEARALVSAAVDRTRRLFGFCEFCGRPCRGRVCSAHRDLLEVDPHQQLRTRKETT